jgi:type IV pilus assembly protein PilE
VAFRRRRAVWAQLEPSIRIHQNRGQMHHSSHSNRDHLKRRVGGFTLLELIIAMMIAAILVAVALPSFLDSIRKGRRSEAMTGLTALQQEQERWRSNNQTYSDSLTALRVTSPTNPSGYYTLGISNHTATGYEAYAIGTGSSQANDGQCAVLGVKVDRGNISYASCSSCATNTLTYAATNTCWAR